MCASLVQSFIMVLLKPWEPRAQSWCRLLQDPVGSVQLSAHAFCRLCSDKYGPSPHFSAAPKTLLELSPPPSLVPSIPLSVVQELLQVIMSTCSDDALPHKDTNSLGARVVPLVFGIPFLPSYLIHGLHSSNACEMK